MKPIVIYLDKETLESNKVEMSRKEFEELLQNVYNQGYSDGRYNYNYYPYISCNGTGTTFPSSLSNTNIDSAIDSASSSSTLRVEDKTHLEDLITYSTKTNS